MCEVDKMLVVGCKGNSLLALRVLQVGEQDMMQKEVRLPHDISKDVRRVAQNILTLVTCRKMVNDKLVLVAASTSTPIMIPLSISTASGLVSPCSHLCTTQTLT